MIVRKSRLLLDEDEAHIVTTVWSEAGHFMPFDLRIGVPRAFVGWLDRTANPFVPTLLLLAGTLGERLRLEGAVSARLLANASKACDLFQSWWDIAPVAVEADALATEWHPGTGCALFFTRGVDSWHSALRDRTAEHTGPITHLLYSAELDRHYSPPTRRRALAATRDAALSVGLPLVPVSHNGRVLIDPFVNWERSHGGVLAGIGLMLGGWFANVHVPSSHDLNHLIPWGSNPSLDPLWSTERTAVHLDGSEVTRTAKVAAIASSDFALSRLKVCWRADIDTNCGQCEKCLRTQCALAIAGALERAPVFLEPLSLAAVKDLPPIDGTPAEYAREPLWVELCESFPDEPRLAKLRWAACARLPTWHPLSTALAKNAVGSITIEAPAGAAISLLPASARDLLPAPLSGREAHRAEDAGGRQIEITWTVPAPGRVALPLRPPLSMALDLLDACRDSDDRPSHWCLIAFASRETARLMERLTESWGQGVAFLTRAGQAEGDHGVPHGEASLVQRCSHVRVWWGEGDYLDPFLVLESLRHGCLPLQCVPEASHEELAACLPPGLSRFTLAIPETGPILPLSRLERDARLDQGLSVLLSGSLERDLAQIIHPLSYQIT